MTTAPYAGLRAASRADSLKPAAAMKPEDEMEEAEEAEAEDAGDKKKSKDKEKEYMSENEAAAAAARAATERAIAVMSCEHFAGREAQAKTLLANDKLSADEIITILADLAPANAADPEAAALAEMKAALEANAESGVEANDASTQVSPASEAADVWAFATAKVFPNNKFA